MNKTPALARADVAAQCLAEGTLVMLGSASDARKLAIALAAHRYAMSDSELAAAFGLSLSSCRNARLWAKRVCPERIW